MIIRALARRFCTRQTFAEQLDDVAAYARRMRRLGQLQRYLALTLGGEAGARLAARIAVPVSADTLPRMAVATVPSKGLVRTPRVLDVDDWTWRRGHRCGSILVDLERNQVADLFSCRQAETVAIGSLSMSLATAQELTPMV